MVLLAIVFYGFFRSIAKKARPGEDQAPEPLLIDSLSVGPSLFPPGVKVSANLLGGSAFARVSLFGTVRVEVDDLDLSDADGPLRLGAPDGLRAVGRLDRVVERRRECAVARGIGRIDAEGSH